MREYSPSSHSLRQFRDSTSSIAYPDSLLDVDPTVFIAAKTDRPRDGDLSQPASSTRSERLKALDRIKECRAAVILSKNSLQRSISDLERLSSDAKGFESPDEASAKAISSLRATFDLYRFVANEDRKALWDLCKISCREGSFAQHSNARSTASAAISLQEPVRSSPGGSVNSLYAKRQGEVVEGTLKISPLLCCETLPTQLSEPDIKFRLTHKTRSTNMEDKLQVPGRSVSSPVSPAGGAGNGQLLTDE